MKTYRYLAGCLCTAALGAAMASCSSDDPAPAAAAPGQQQVTPVGETSYLSLTIYQNLGRAGEDTEAESIFAASDAENALSNVTVYVFDNNVCEIAGKQVTVNQNVTEAIQTTVGMKTVYVTAGTLTGLTAPTVGTTTIEQFEQSLFTSTVDVIAPSTVDASHTFAMLGKSAPKMVVPCTQAEAGTKNEYAVTVYRASAKAQLKFATVANTETGTPNFDPDKVKPTLNAWFTGASFQLVQNAKQMYVGPVHTISALLTANGLFTPQGGNADNDGTYDNYTTVPDNGTYAPAIASEWDNTPANTCYTAENRPETPVTGNTTFALARLTVAPKTFCKVGETEPTPAADGTFHVLAYHESATATYIFHTDLDYNIVYFASEDDAKAYATEKGLYVVSDDNTKEDCPEGKIAYELFTYNQGNAYYRINLINDAMSAVVNEKYSVQRNSFYQIAVNNINNLGAPDENGVIPDDPDQPLDPEYWLVAKITVAPWRVVPQGTTL